MFDIESPHTWSAKLLEVLTAMEYRDRRSFSKYEKSSFIAEVPDRTILAYHATRLTRGEIENVKNNGLQPAGENLTKFKLINILKDGQITNEEYNLLTLLSEFNLKPEQNRSNQICLLLGSFALGATPSKLHHFWDKWGGEIINMNVIEKPLIAKLQSIGEPVTVKVVISDFLEADIVDEVILGAQKTLIGAPESIAVYIPTEKQNLLKVVDVHMCRQE